MKSFFSELILYTANRWISIVPSHSFRLWFYRSVMRFNIGDNSAVFMGCSFDCKDNLVLGANSVINANCRIDTRGGVIIGNNVSISSDVIILTADHDIQSHDFSGRARRVVIEDYVWIGTRAMILPGVTIGKGAVVAAGAVVNKDVQNFTVVGGIPAKFLKNRSKILTYKVSYQRLFQ